MKNLTYLHTFQSDISAIAIPERFTFPFSYQPHELTKQAAKEVINTLSASAEIEEGFGKMYGVLVVRNQFGELGYLVAFSGQEEEPDLGIKFVPPIFDRLKKEGFFKKGEGRLQQINKQVEALENDPQRIKLQSSLQQTEEEAKKIIKAEQEKKQVAKANRKEQREEALIEFPTGDYEKLLEKLKKESVEEHFQYKELVKKWQSRTEQFKKPYEKYVHKIKALKAERKQQSNALQQKLFDHYQFLNANGEVKTLADVFEDYGKPPSGSGDCAAPKLLNFAYQHQLEPIAMGEFWVGKPPKSEVRRPGYFYPACSGRCKPILGHMLQGLPLDPDPLKNYSGVETPIQDIFEDDFILIINKPAGLLSIPSKEITDSVQSRMEKRFPKTDGPLLAHRLDKLTSGLMIITKSKEAYVHIQQQFMEKTIKKKYLAILDGIIEDDAGYISLPLTVDEANRPMQKVDYEKGKPSKTKYKVLSRTEGKTRIQFSPITGRTHQLRVHSAHIDGLNAPIIGDKLYGKPDDRLLLHAARISFIHPKTAKNVSFEAVSEF